LCGDFWNFGGQKFAKEKEIIFRHWTACENSKFRQFENHWGNLQDEADLPSWHMYHLTMLNF